MEGFLTGVAEGMLNHFSQPATEGGDSRSGHGEGGETFSMDTTRSDANENLL
jgi:hypothetical protein